MHKYGILKNGNLQIVPSGTPGAKPIIHAEVPEFDQERQAVFETTPVDMGNHTFVGIEIREVEQDEGNQDHEML